MKTVIVTGASHGIGKATVIRFAQEGCNVVINYNSSSNKALKIQNELQSKHYSAVIKKADVSNYNEAKSLIDFAYEKYGRIDILINNCGEPLYGLVTDTKYEDFKKNYEINVGSVYNCCHHVIPYMLKNHYGKIINVSSIWGISGASNEVIYSASKAAVIGFTKALAKELAPSNINVNCVAPGVINTNMIKELDEKTKQLLKNETPLGRLGICEDVSNVVNFLASDEASFITGQVISPNGGFVI